MDSKSLLKDLNIENKAKLTFRPPKLSTPSSSTSILPSPTSISQAISPISTLSSHYPSKCVSLLILPTFTPTLLQFFEAYTSLLSILLIPVQSVQPYPPSTPIFSTIFLSSPYQHVLAYLLVTLTYLNISINEEHY